MPSCTEKERMREVISGNMQNKMMIESADTL